jgi:hypothetical protein
MFDVLPPEGKKTNLPVEEADAFEPEGPEATNETADEKYTPYTSDSFLQKLASEKKEIPSFGGPESRSRLFKFLAIGTTVLMTLFAAAWAIGANFSRATVTLVADRAFSPFSFEVNLDTAVETPNWAAREIPLQLLRKTMEQKKEYPATGEREVVANARGRVTLRNGMPASQRLVARTRLQSPDGKIFRLAAPVTIPANASISAEAIADQPGPEYNIGPARFTLPAFREQGMRERYEKIHAESTEPFRGGASGKTTVVRQEDIRSAQEQISREVLDILGRDIREAIPDGFVMMDQGAMRLSVNNISADARINDAREKFAVTLNATAEALIFDERHIAELARRQIGNEALLEALPNIAFDFAYTVIQPADFNNGTLKLKVDGSVNIAKSIDAAKITQELAGKREAEVHRKLITIPGIQEARVALWPFWMRHLPQSVDRIEIRIE